MCTYIIYKTLQYVQYIIHKNSLHWNSLKVKYKYDKVTVVITVIIFYQLTLTKSILKSKVGKKDKRFPFLQSFNESNKEVSK